MRLSVFSEQLPGKNRLNNELKLSLQVMPAGFLLPDHRHVIPDRNNMI